AVQDVASLHGSDAGGCSGKDQVARRQTEELRELGDDFGDIPDQGGEIGTLDALAIAFQPDRSFFRMADLACSRHCRAWSREVKGLSGIPWASHFLSLQLKITPRHVEPHRVSVDVIQRVFDANVRTASAYSGNQLELVMHVMRG